MATHIHIHTKDGLVTGAVKAANKLNEAHSKSYGESVSDGFEEEKHPRGPSGQFAKTHEVASRHGFTYKGEVVTERGENRTPKKEHVWEHESGARLHLTTGGIGRGTGSHVATVHLGLNSSRSEADPTWPENAARKALRKAGISPKK